MSTSLIEWTRTWNSDPSHTPKLQFVGFDMQHPSASLRAVRQFLKQVAPHDAAGWLAEIDVLGHEAGMQAFVALPKEKQAAVSAAVAALVARFGASQRAWEAATSPAAFAVAHQDARTLQQGAAQFAQGALTPAGSAQRDQAMAENIQWLHDHLPPGERMVVSAHNLHIADVKARMGRALRATLGSSLLTVGLELGDGTFQAIRRRSDGAHPNIEAIELSPPPAGQVNAALLHAAPEVYALDLRRLPAEGEVAAWFRSPQLVREVGRSEERRVGKEC